MGNTLSSVTARTTASVKKGWAFGWVSKKLSKPPASPPSCLNQPRKTAALAEVGPLPPTREGGLAAAQVYTGVLEMKLSGQLVCCLSDQQLLCKTSWLRLVWWDSGESPHL